MQPWKCPDIGKHHNRSTGIGDLMSATISTSSERPTATNAAQHTRFHSLSTHAMTLVSLLAVYAPPALVLLLNRSVIAKVYLVVGIWAIEGIAWYWLKNHVFDRGDRGAGARWRADYN